MPGEIRLPTMNWTCEDWQVSCESGSWWHRARSLMVQLVCRAASLWVTPLFHPRFWGRLFKLVEMFMPEPVAMLAAFRDREAAAQLASPAWHPHSECLWWPRAPASSIAPPCISNSCLARWRRRSKMQPPQGFVPFLLVLSPSTLLNSLPLFRCLFVSFLCALRQLCSYLAAPCSFPVHFQ